MQTELASKRECRYSLRQCHKVAMDGYQYCHTHILEDTNSPFQQCSYISTKTGRRCVQAAFKPQRKEGLCPQHSAKVNRTRCAVAKKQLATKSDSSECLLGSLAHYSSTLYNNNRTDIKAQHQEAATSYLAELASSSDSDIEDRANNSSSLWTPDSDSESIDSENEDVFKYAEVLTAEETTRITRDKLIRLQSLYIEQFKWLQHVLKEGRRKYLKRKAEEKAGRATNDGDATEHGSEVEGTDTEATSDICPLPQIDTDSAVYNEYIASRRYHKRHGQEALMYIRSQERRRTVCDAAPSDSSYVHNRYRHASRHGTKYCSLKSVKCHERSLPFARFCLHHIEFDTHQVLYRRCGYQAVAGGLQCERIVNNINEKNRCDYHTNISDLQAMCTTTQNNIEEALNEVDVVDDTINTTDTPISNMESAPIDNEELDTTQDVKQSGTDDEKTDFAVDEQPLKSEPVNGGDGEKHDEMEIKMEDDR